uniref:Uncharacterized protein n=1 Tax=Arundo donax TaxID=35708 RepID=A0A0A9FAC1_ARUDO
MYHGLTFWSITLSKQIYIALLPLLLVVCTHSSDLDQTGF